MDIVSRCQVVSRGVNFSYLCVGHVESTVRMEKSIGALSLKLKVNENFSEYEKKYF